MDMICKNGHKMDHVKTVWNNELKKFICPECGTQATPVPKSQEEKNKDILFFKICGGFIILWAIYMAYLVFGPSQTCDECKEECIAKSESNRKNGVAPVFGVMEDFDICLQSCRVNECSD